MAHMIQGATLDAAFVDPQDASSKVSQTMQTAAYVCLSRVKELLKICVVQAFSPLLFTRGPPAGPHRLMRKLGKKITTEEAAEEWWEESNKEPSEDTKNAGSPLGIKHLCTSCYLQGKNSYMLGAKEFGVTRPEDFYNKYISQGCWTRCLQCQKDHGVKITCSDLMATLPTEQPKEHQKHGMCKICKKKI